MTDTTTTASGKTKAIAAALAFGAAAALAWASFSTHWAQQIAYGQDTFGLRTWVRCTDDGVCDARSIETFARYAKSDVFPILGWVASVSLWLAAASLAAAAALMLAGRFIARPIALTTVALVSLAVGLISGFVFLATRPPENYGPGPGFWAFAAGELVGIVSTILVARIRPADPEWDDPEPFDEEKWAG
jgi:hypothetical protein